MPRANRPESVWADSAAIKQHTALYARLLQGKKGSKHEGRYALWEPIKNCGLVGDCGYITGGRFIKFYNVFDSVNDVNIPPVPKTIRSEEANDFDDLLLSRRLSGINFSDAAAILPTTCDVSPPKAFERSEKLAFLAFRSSKPTVQSYDQVELLERYIAEHGPQIETTYKNRYPIKLRDIIIVYEAVLAASWVGAISSSSVGGIVSSPGTVNIPFSPEGWRISPGEPIEKSIKEPVYAVVVKFVHEKNAKRFRAPKALPGALRSAADRAARCVRAAICCV